GARAFALLALLAFVWITLQFRSTREGLYMICADAPTVGLAACSTASLMGSRRGISQMLVAAICGVLACWCKQSALPVLLVPPLYLLLADGWFAARRQLLITAAVGIVTSAAMLLSFGPARMWFHMVQLPARQPFANEASLGR